MSVMKSEVRPGAYFDSVVLMQLQKALAELEGVDDAGVVMATPANKELLAPGDLLPDDVAAKADDLLIVIKAADEDTAAAALGRVDDLLQKRQTGGAGDFRPKSLAAGVKMLPEANWVLISVPGRFAAGVADEALELGKHVFLYSDNVPLADEIKLKKKAQQRGLLVMGPDCGTALINGVGLGFANRVGRGNIGIVAASGTGLQAVSTEVHNLGGGISQAIGTGGRDLKEDVGGITAAQALDLLAGDDATSVIVLISKPPAAAVAAQLLARAQNCGKPVVVDFIGFPPPGRRIGNLHFAGSLADAAEQAVQIVNTPGLEGVMGERKRPFTGFVRGLFSGGTLAYEMLLGLQAILAPLYSNLAAKPEQRLADLHKSQGHVVIDMGEDEFTQGRLHPMMDNDLRLRRLRQEAADPAVGMIVLDVVLGEGSHPDPAAELAPAIADAVQMGKKVLAIVVGTEQDPQEINGQIERLAAAGATVLPNTSEGLDYIYNRVPAPKQAADAKAVDAAAFGGKGLAVVNVGLESFYDSVVAQGGQAIHVDWRPPAGGNEKLMAILAKMKG
jgi:FdrA protein